MSCWILMVQRVTLHSYLAPNELKISIKAQDFCVKVFDAKPYVAAAPSTRGLGRNRQPVSTNAIQLIEGNTLVCTF